MKKILLTLLLVFCTASMLTAQNDFKADIMSILRDEGYAPSPYNESVTFKIPGKDNIYLCRIQQVGNKFALVEISTTFRMEDFSYAESLEIANELNYHKYGCKCSVFMDEGDSFLKIILEFVTASQENSEFQIKQTLRLMPSWIEEFHDIIADK